MKLLIISYGGLTEDRRAIYREYVLQGVDLTVIVPSFIPVDRTYVPSGYLQFDASYSEKGYNVIPVNLIKPNFIDSFDFFSLYKNIKKIDPDVIQVFNEYTSLHLTEAILSRNLIYKRKIPIIAYTFENIPFKKRKFLLDFSVRGFKNNISKLIQPFILSYHKKNVDAVVSCNLEGIENIKKMGLTFTKEKIFRGVEIENFYKKDQDMCRDKLGLPRGVKIAGCFCRIVKEKGLDDLVDAIYKLEDYMLMIVGSGIYKKKIQERIEKLGISNKIYFFDPVNSKELLDYYNCLDVFVLPSRTSKTWKEQYGMVLIEAMACGLKVVGSSSGAIPEVLMGYPKGLVFQEGDMENLVQKIKDVEQLKDSGDFNFKNFLYKFSIENFVKKHIELFKKLLNYA